MEGINDDRYLEMKKKKGGGGGEENGKYPVQSGD